MSEQHPGQPASRGEAVERKLWSGLTDYALEAFGTAAIAGAVVREAFVRDNPDLVAVAIANQLGDEAVAYMTHASQAAETAQAA